ncbi:hypothetical protein, partial [Bacillus pumilus]|uniref:hypothetical protein n=1 Tax=Bacillus pumilus TaxID=1408 RepID=UPI001C92F8F7
WDEEESRSEKVLRIRGFGGEGIWRKEGCLKVGFESDIEGVDLDRWYDYVGLVVRLVIVFVCFNELLKRNIVAIVIL